MNTQHIGGLHSAHFETTQENETSKQLTAQPALHGTFARNNTES